MGIRDTLKRLVQGNEPSPAQVEEEGHGRPVEGDDEAPLSLPQIALPPGDTLPEHAEKVTGKRRPSDTSSGNPQVQTATSHVPAATGRRRPPASATRPRARSQGALASKEENPTDYLYFGPGLEPAAARRSGAPARASAKTPETRRRALSSGCAVPRTDDSGFLNTGVAGARQQMGYQNLTYGGSLQYDYSGTQAPF